MAQSFAKVRATQFPGIAASVLLKRASGGHNAIGDHGRVSCNVARTFSSRASRACDFGASVHALVSIIFLLTSFCVDSIHSISCNRRPLRNSMNNGKGE